MSLHSDFYAEHHPVKVLAAHDGGPMTVSELTAEATRIDGRNWHPAHIATSLGAARLHGEVRFVGERQDDYREQTWELAA